MTNICRFLVPDHTKYQKLKYSISSLRQTYKIKVTSACMFRSSKILSKTVCRIDANFGIN